MVIIPISDLITIEQVIDSILLFKKNNRISWITINEACTILKINKKSLYYHSKAGNIGYSVIGNLKFYKREEVLSLKDKGLKPFKNKS